MKKLYVTPRAVMFWFFAAALTAVFVLSSLAVQNQSKKLIALCDEILSLSEQERYEEANEAAIELGKEWEKDKIWWGFLFEHMETDSIEQNVDQVTTHVKAKRADYIEEYATLLKTQMEHIREIEGLHLKSLI